MKHKHFALWAIAAMFFTLAGLATVWLGCVLGDKYSTAVTVQGVTCAILGVVCSIVGLNVYNSRY